MFGIITGICAGISAAIGVVSTAICSVGGALVAGAKALIPIMSTVSGALEVVSRICTVIVAIASILGIAKEDEKLDEIGAKTLQEDTRPKLEGESAEEYMEYLRNEVELDREKFEKLKEEEKLACSAIGARLMSDSIEEKLGFDLPSNAILAAGLAKMSSNEFKVLIDKFKENDINSLKSIDGYLGNKLDINEGLKVDDIVSESIKKANPELSEDKVRERDRKSVV